MAKRGAHDVTADKNVATLSDEDIREQWRRWLVEIRNQIWMLQLDNYLYRGTLAMAQANLKIEGQIFTLRLENSFYTTQLMALRRLADIDKDVISFQTLFRQVLHLLDQKQPILTRAAFVDRYNKRYFRRPSKPSRSSEEFDKLVGPEKDSLTKEDVGGDRARLIQAYQKVSGFINNVVSHYSAETMNQLRPGPHADPSSYTYPALPSDEDLTAVFGCLEVLLEKYWKLLYANDEWRFPVIASNIWGIFKKPWVTSKKPDMPVPPDVSRRQR